MKEPQKLGWFIPQCVLMEPDLSMGEKPFMGLVVNLRGKNGCRCSNSYIAKELGTTVCAIKNMARRLRERGHLLENTYVWGKEFNAEHYVPAERYLHPLGAYLKGGSKMTRSGSAVLPPTVSPCYPDSNSTVITEERERAAPDLSPNPQTPEAKRKNLEVIIQDFGVPAGFAEPWYDRELKSRNAAGDKVKSWGALGKMAYESLQASENLKSRSARPRSQYKPSAASNWMPPEQKAAEAASQFSQFSGQN